MVAIDRLGGHQAVQAGEGDGKATRPEPAPPAVPRGWSSAAPQIIACMTAGLFNVPEGLALAYTSSLIPDLQRAGSDVPITLNEGVLLASGMTFAVALGTFLAGAVMNKIGRLNTIRLCAAPFSLGWFLIASSTSYEQIVAGRILTGLAIPLGINAAVVFTTEVAEDSRRIALSSSHTAMASLGIVLMYVLGAYTDWRTAAWIAGSTPAVCVVLSYALCSESPIWLVSKGRREQALASLRYYARSYPTPELRERLPELQLEYLVQRRVRLEVQAKRKSRAPMYRKMQKLFTTAAGLKPLLIMTGLFLAQNFSGLYMTLFYATPFLQAMGVRMDAYEVAILVGLTRLVSGVLAVLMLRAAGVRRPVMCSSLAMAASMAAAGYFTLYPDQGLGGWVAVGLVLVYVASSCFGLLTVPWAMAAELYPDKLRDVGQAVTSCIGDSSMSVGLQLYPVLMDAFRFDGVPSAVGLQWFFAAVALASCVYTFIFLPETHGMSLQEIDEHFQHNTTWLGRKRPPKPAKGGQPDLELGAKPAAKLDATLEAGATRL